MPSLPLLFGKQTYLFFGFDEARIYMQYSFPLYSMYLKQNDLSRPGGLCSGILETTATYVAANVVGSNPHEMKSLQICG